MHLLSSWFSSTKQWALFSPGSLWTQCHLSSPMLQWHPRKSLANAQRIFSCQMNWLMDKRTDEDLLWETSITSLSLKQCTKRGPVHCKFSQMISGSFFDSHLGLHSWIWFPIRVWSWLQVSTTTDLPCLPHAAFCH